MYKIMSSLAAALLCCTRLMAGDPVYPVKAIPDSMRENAHLVKRFEEIVQTISGPKEVNVVTHYVLTVLDEEGAEASTLVESYNKQVDVRSISGALYDADGKLVKRLKQSDIKDLSVDGDGSLMTDTRYKVHRFYHNIYPYTVEYEVEERVNNTYHLRSWMPQVIKECTVELSRFVVETPVGYKLRYLASGAAGEPKVAEKGKVAYSWEVKNIPAFTGEPYSREFVELSANVLLSPSVFKFDDYEGNGTTWEGLGKFGYTINAGRDELPDNIKQKVQELTAGQSSKAQKIQVLYKWLQQNYRYISIQLGIGGLQTFDAKTVAAKGYGDCKALSNYMMALLKEAGIKSYCAWVKAGEGEKYINEQFPDDDFNHVILCVPDKDTTWLECTSNTLPAGYLSGFTSDRAVLLLTEEGGKLVHTPALGMKDNRQVRTVNAVMQDNGNLKVSAVTMRSGEEQETLHEALHVYSKDKQLEMMRKSLDLSSYDVGKFDCRELPALIPEIEEQLDLNCNAYATVTGKRIFIVPNILNRSRVGKLEPDSNRISDVVLKFAFEHVDSVSITVPEGYKAEAMPAPVALQTKFGSYSATAAMKGNTITYIRKLQRKAGIFPAAEYNEFAKFYTAIYRADRNRMVLVKE
ncbi:DUF3857 domain-containing protein [Chitinophaga varians]|uniref:DUF3857 domain-containing protein n=1 Tax=Chitinophaga varians TaxID=2202339 RepID=A0A847RIM8_9BACT|nr:DUF3857 domain-containing protein [Chitinophaga varians]NLR62953.1 DUF3857 domain-containing protein [Chitinophaga varians]